MNEKMIMIATSLNTTTVMKTSILSALVASLTLPTTLLAQAVPEQLSYQGHVAVDGTNFTGNGYFKFALIDPGATVSHWSNDGTSAAGSEPTASVVLPVVDGLYSAALGDTTLANMTAISPDVFENNDVHLRIWFDDGSNGSQLLTPDQPILSVGYAMMAEHVPDGSITSDQLAPSAIDSTHLAPNSVNSGHIIDGEVNTQDIANDAVTTVKLADNSVNSDKLADVISLGSAAASGHFDIWDAANGVSAFEINGLSHQMSAYGADGLERIRLWGNSYGQIRLHDSQQNTLTAWLSAGNDGLLVPELLLNSPNGSARAELRGETLGGRLNLYGSRERDPNGGTGDSVLRAILYGDEGAGVGALSLRDIAGNARLRAYGGPHGRMELLSEAGSSTMRLFGGSSAGSLWLYNSLGNANVGLWSWDNEEGVVSVRNRLGDETLYLWGRNSQDNGGGQLGLKKSNGSETITLNADVNGGPSMVMRNGGGAINLWGYSYDNEEGVLSVRNKFGNETVYLWGRDSADVNGGQIGLKESDGTETLTLQASEVAGNGAQIVLRQSDGTASIILDADQGGSGRITADVVQINGADLSEQFDITTPDIKPEPGMLVCIDPNDPGKLVISSKAYDRTAAGIISGAGGVRPGLLMSQEGTLANGEHPVALTGRVYCNVDATSAPIEPGDLITTSDVPGYGMKAVDHFKAQGAIIGKAMTSLKAGRGQVLVLVSLQ